MITTMEEKTTNHFIVYFELNSLAEKEIDFIVQSLEKSYDFIIKTLKLKNDFPKIEYYLYSSNKSKLEAMGDAGNANAVVKNFAVHGVYNQKIKIVGRHEIVHLLVNNWGRPPELLRQGLAEAMEEKWHGVNHLEWVKKFQREKKLISLSELIDDKEFWQYSDLVTYPESGSFVKFLIEKYGLENFKKLYQELGPNFSDEQNEKIFQQIFNKSLTDLETEWFDL